VSRGGVCPVSWTQDQVGPIGRTVEDVMRVFEVISGGYDERDNVTAVRVFGMLLNGSLQRHIRWTEGIQ